MRKMLKLKLFSFKIYSNNLCFIYNFKKYFYYVYIITIFILFSILYKIKVYNKCKTVLMD